MKLELVNKSDQVVMDNWLNNITSVCVCVCGVCGVCVGCVVCVWCVWSVVCHKYRVVMYDGY